MNDDRQLQDLALEQLYVIEQLNEANDTCEIDQNDLDSYDKMHHTKNEDASYIRELVLNHIIGEYLK